ncbi:MAG TPA: serine hydrolase domain-containing protein [Pyrinomonadaceae bacterium]|nr:serine hydrolase domain-containing protein [Pyrinomonadaceae bacterium]
MTSHARILLALLLLCGTCRPLTAQTPAAADTTRRPAAQPADVYAERLRLFEEFVRERMAREKVPGLTVGFFKGGYVWVKGFGYADLENKVPATADSVYRLASVTKPMTAVAVLQLVERGKIKLDEEIQAYVPDYPKQKWPVTVRQLLAHLGGGQTGSGLGAERKSVREVVELISKAGLASEPGTKFVYTTSGYNLLGAAVEHASGMSFAEYMRENVWLPAGMTATHLDDPGSIVPNRVRGYELSDGKVRNAPFVDVSTRFGGGGATGTVPDVLRFAQGLRDGRLLKSKEILAEMYAPAVDRGGRFMDYEDGWDYSLGWFVTSRNGRFALHHDGGQKGTATALLYVPSEDFAVAVACNADWADKWPYARRLFELVFEESWDVPVRTTKSRYDAALYKALRLSYERGALQYERERRPLAADAKELARAFEYFNRAVERRTVESSFDEASKRIADGRHPAADLALVKLGSYMAARLVERFGEERLSSYRRRGAVAFFGDFVELYKSDPRHPKELTFDAPLEATLARWHAGWSRAWDEEARRLKLKASLPEIISAGERLRKNFEGAEVVPDFVGELLNGSVAAFHKGDSAVAMRAAALAADLYPHEDITNFVLALNLVAAGDTERARNALRKSLAAKPNGIASAARLKQNAKDLASAKKTDVALGLLSLGFELHPSDASLYETAAELVSKQGQTERADEFRRKAQALKEGRPEK